MNRITNNWNLKLTALVMAIALWTHVRGEVNPVETVTFQVPLRYEPPRTLRVLNSDKIPASVKVTLRGPRLALRELTGAAPANPLAPSDEVPKLPGHQASASLDFTTAHRGQQNLPVKAESALTDVDVYLVKPSDVMVVLESTTRPRVAPSPG